MKNLEREIRTYNITSLTLVRGTGSQYGKGERRCLWEICGKSSLQWVLETVKASKYVNKVVLSTEDKKIMEVGEKIGGVTIIPRPIHTVFNMPRDYHVGVFQRQRPRSLFSGVPDIYTNYRFYCHWYLQKYESFVADIEVGATADEPLGTTESLDRLIEAFFSDDGANMARTMCPIMPYIYTINPVTKRPFPLIVDYGLDRQCYPPLYRSGPFTVYGNPGEKEMYEDRSKLAYVVVSPEEGLDIHNEEDLFLANCYMERRLAKQKQSGGGDGT